jgi:uncharacterized protein YdcH (DUF465 family)
MIGAMEQGDRRRKEWNGKRSDAAGRKCGNRVWRDFWNLCRAGGVDLYQGTAVRRGLTWASQTGALPMTHISPHIHDAFPGDAGIITRLKTESPHFRNLVARFDVINHEAAEAAVTAPDARVEALKKRRLALLDEIAILIDHCRVD